jgi:hypothetical protein
MELLGQVWSRLTADGRIISRAVVRSERTLTAADAESLRSLIGPPVVGFVRTRVVVGFGARRNALAIKVTDELPSIRAAAL